MRAWVLGCGLLAACSADESGSGAAGSAGEGGAPNSIDAGSSGSSGTRGGGASGASSGGAGGTVSVGSGGEAGSVGAGGLGASGAAGASGSGGTAGQASGGAGGSGGSPPSTDAPCDDTCHFVRQGATGAGDGATWADAWAELPATLARGHRYYVADGSYPGYTFDDPASGTEPVVVIKATDARHGGDAGWLSEYGDAAASFGTLSFDAPYVELDGTSALGFRAVGDFQGSVVDVSADHVTLRHLEVDGDFGANSSGIHDRGACTGLSIGGSFVRVEQSNVHDVADDGVSASNVEELDFEGNTVHALHACGTDGGCGPCYNGHSDGIELFDVVRSRLVGNLVYDVRSTATLFFGNWADSLGNGPSDYCEDIVLANNLFYAPEVGLVAYLQDVSGLEVYHNVFWGLRQGGYGGLSIGPNVTGLRLYNNIILSINTAHTGGAFDPTEHDSDFNAFGVSIGQWTEGANSIVAPDPGFVGIAGMDGPAVADPAAGDFAIAAGSPAENAGTTDLAFPKVDYFGVARDASPDIGAIER